MASQAIVTEQAENTRNSRLADAIRSWHRGDRLTPEQADMIDDARIETIARAVGLHS